MRLSRESRYALEGLAVLAAHPAGEVVDAREIADRAQLPAAYLSKIFRSLALAGVLRSRRGRGYSLWRPAEQITLGEILRAVEGDHVIWESCIFWREECDDAHPCPLHFRWADMKPQVQDAMGSVTLADIAEHRPP